MGKKISQASLKICKSSEKKQINSLIKVLRPKVYITDTSSFKKLVQQLTGNNGTTTATNTTSPPPPPPPQQQPSSTRPEPISDYHRLEVVVPESSAELSVDSNEIAWQNQACFAEITTLDYNYPCSTNELHGEEYWPVYQDIESWLLDIEPFSSSYNCGQVEQELCIYDYELSGLI